MIGSAFDDGLVLDKVFHSTVNHYTFDCTVDSGDAEPDGWYHNDFNPVADGFVPKHARAILLNVRYLADAVGQEFHVLVHDGPYPVLRIRTMIADFYHDSNFIVWLAPDGGVITRVSAGASPVHHLAYLRITGILY